MSEEVYEILSLGARYWFAFLGVVIVWRAFRWLRKDRRAKHRRLRQLPDAGMIGEMVVVAGAEQLPEGSAVPIPREGTMGYLRSCDVVIPCPGVAPRHCDFTFEDGKGLLLRPRHRCLVTVDGETVTPRTRASLHPMHHGSRLTVGEAELRLRLFAGLETERRSALQTDAPETAPAPETLPAPDWQDTTAVYHQIPAQWADTGLYPPAQTFPGNSPQNPADPAAWQGYPPQDPADPAAWQGYPPQNPADPAAWQGYPPQNSTDPAAWQGYPPQNSTDPAAWQGYPPQNSTDPAAWQGYPPQNPADSAPPASSAPEEADDDRPVMRTRRSLLGRRRRHGP